MLVSSSTRDVHSASVVRHACRSERYSAVSRCCSMRSALSVPSSSSLVESRSRSRPSRSARVDSCAARSRPSASLVSARSRRVSLSVTSSACRRLGSAWCARRSASSCARSASHSRLSAVCDSTACRSSVRTCWSAPSNAARVAPSSVLSFQRFGGGSVADDRRHAGPAFDEEPFGDVPAFGDGAVWTVGIGAGSGFGSVMVIRAAAACASFSRASSQPSRLRAAGAPMRHRHRPFRVWSAEASGVF